MSRFRRPRWRDPRLGVGVLLVAISVALGGWVFARADKTEPVYLATETIAVGDDLQTAPMELVSVNLGEAGDAYLSPAALEGLSGTEGWFTRAVPAGELVPLEAVGRIEDLRMRPVSLPVASTSSLAAGDVVDMWVTQDDVSGQETAEPTIVASGLHVRSVQEDDSLFATSRGMIVHVLVPQEDLALVLGAMSGRAVITLVPELHG